MKKILIILVCSLLLTACVEDGTETIYQVLTFENADAKNLAGPTFIGNNLYSPDNTIPGYAYGPGMPGYDENFPNFVSYHDETTDLIFGINEGSDLQYNFWNGGIAISQWNDITTHTYENQCSVYYQDELTGNGGHNGSKTFGIVYYAATEDGSLPAPALSFKNTDTERVIESMWVMNATYAYQTMKEGGAFGAKQYTFVDGDWLLLTVEGYDKSGTKKSGKVEIYLADFRSADSPGIANQWIKADLSSLGKVQKINFTLTCSDMAGIYLNTPSYFCIDDVTVRI